VQRSPIFARVDFFLCGCRSGDRLIRHDGRVTRQLFVDFGNAIEHVPRQRDGQNLARCQQFGDFLHAQEMERSGRRWWRC
jgi:hypothetical protein